jgi:hypothetical protein
MKVTDRFDCVLRLLPSGEVRIHGNERGFNAARDFLGFKQPFIEGSRWPSIDVAYHQRVPVEVAREWAHAIERGIGPESRELANKVWGSRATKGNKTFPGVRAGVIAPDGEVWDSSADGPFTVLPEHELATW